MRGKYVQHYALSGAIQFTRRFGIHIDFLFQRLVIVLTLSVEQIPSWEADDEEAGQENPHLLGKPKIR